MATETYAKNGQVSKKNHIAKGQGSEHYLRRLGDKPPSLGGGPDTFERKYENEYRKTSLPHNYPEDDWMM